jgi:O-antigen/teichoic acid export membrane protein
MHKSKWFDKESIAESAGIVLAFTIVRQVLQTGRGIIFARVLGPGEYGVYTLAFFFIPLIAAVARLGVPSSFARYVPQYEKRGMLRDFAARTFFMATSASVAITLLCLLLPEWISGLIYNSPDYKTIIIVCSLSILPMSAYECLVQTYNGLRVFKLSYSLAFAQFLAFTVLGIVLVLVFHTAVSAVIGNLVSLVLVVLIFGILLLRYLNRDESSARRIEEKGFYRKIFKYSIWFVISPIVFNLFRYTDRWMLNYFLGLEKVGIYSIATNVTGLLFAFGIVIGNVIMPTLSSLWEEGEKEKARDILDFSVRGNTLVLLSAAVLIMIFKDEIIGVLYGSEYEESAVLVGVLLIFWLLNTIYWTIGGYSGLIEKTYIPLVCNSFGLVCNVILNYILIPRYGIMGAAAATTIAFGCILIMIIVWYWREGFTLKPSSLFICLVPLMFLLGEIAVAAIFGVIMILVFGTELLMTREERRRMYRQLRESARRYIPVSR